MYARLGEGRILQHAPCIGAVQQLLCILASYFKFHVCFEGNVKLTQHPVSADETTKKVVSYWFYTASFVSLAIQTV